MDQKCVTLTSSKLDLEKFVRNFLKLYQTKVANKHRSCDDSEETEGESEGIRDQPVSINFHYFTHLTDMVEQWGQLPNYSMFPFESKNAYITNHSFTTGNTAHLGMRLSLGSQVPNDQSRSISVPK